MNLQHDKVLHFLAGAAICALMTALGMLCFPEEKVMAFGIGLAFTLMAGCGKELYDGEKADQWDFVATLFGGVVAAALLAAVGLMF